MTDDGGPWIIVPNWDRFQHYPNRTPPWIKVYLELNHNDEWLALTDGARGMLVRIWVLFAASRGVLGMEQVRRQGWTRHSAGHFESLNHAGFIQLSASKPLALTRSRKRSKKENKEPVLAKPENRANAGAYQKYRPPWLNE